MKYVTATITFFFMWFASAFLIGLVMAIIVKPNHPVTVGIGFSPLNLPGSIVGLLVGIHSARVTIKAADLKKQEKEDKNRN